MEERDWEKDQVKKQLEREIDFMNEVKNIPEFVILYDYVIQDEIKLFILMEFVKGPNLEELYVKKFRRAKTPEERREVKKIVWEILRQGSKALSILSEREI